MDDDLEQRLLLEARDLDLIDNEDALRIWCDYLEAQEQGAPVPMVGLLREAGLVAGEIEFALAAATGGVTQWREEPDEPVIVRVETEILEPPTDDDVTTADQDDDSVALGATGNPDRFDRSERLGAGGAAEVWLATDRFLRRQVAIKTPRHRGVSKLRRRFVEEAQITAQLEHPGIPPIYEYGRDPVTGEPYLVMKRIRGRSLGRLLDDLAEGRPVPFSRRASPDGLRSELLDLFRKVGEAVAYAHGRGVIHRDLKPANVMVGDYGDVVVIDWGLARPIDTRSSRVAQAPVVTQRELDTSTAELTVPGFPLGTPRYMSPEQVAMRSEWIDERTDVYGLGAILYRILTLSDPVEGTTRSEILGRVSVGHVEAPSRNSRATWTIPYRLDRIVLTAMAVDPCDRYATVDDLLEELRIAREEIARADQPPPAAPDPGLRRRPAEVAGPTAVFDRRHVLAFGALAAILAFATYGLTRLQLAGARDVARERAEARHERAIEAWRSATGLGTHDRLTFLAAAWFDMERARIEHPDPPGDWTTAALRRLDDLVAEALAWDRFSLAATLLQAGSDGGLIDEMELARGLRRCRDAASRAAED